MGRIRIWKVCAKIGDGPKTSLIKDQERLRPRIKDRKGPKNSLRPNRTMHLAQLGFKIESGEIVLS